jgi:hypothetical protein
MSKTREVFSLVACYDNQAPGCARFADYGHEIQHSLKLVSVCLNHFSVLQRIDMLSQSGRSHPDDNTKESQKVKCFCNKEMSYVE